MRLFVICARPGTVRLGYRHPPVAEHAPDHFTAAQLAELLADPAFAVVRGERVTAETLAAEAPQPDAPPEADGERADAGAGPAASAEGTAAKGAAKNPARTRHGRRP